MNSSDKTIETFRSEFFKQEPETPIQLKAFYFLLMLGLAALFLAAFNAFRAVTGDHIAGTLQALFAALLIEAGLVIEAFSVMRKPKQFWGWIPVAISVFVSATYNTTQVLVVVAERSKGDAIILTLGRVLETALPYLNALTVFALALGPLAALASIAIAAGRIMKDHEAAVFAWTLERDEWSRERFDAFQKKEERRRNKADKARNVQEQETERSGTFVNGEGIDLSVLKNVPERSQEKDALLELVFNRFGFEGFGPKDVVDLVAEETGDELSKKQYYLLRSYALETGDMEEIGRGRVRLKRPLLAN